MDVREKAVLPHVYGSAALGAAIGLALLGGVAAALTALDAVHALRHGYSSGFVELNEVSRGGSC